MTAKAAPMYVTRVTVEGRHVMPPLAIAFDFDGFDLNSFIHCQLVEIAQGLEIFVSSILIGGRECDALDGYVEDAAMFERILVWVRSGTNPDVHLVSAPVPSSRGG